MSQDTSGLNIQEWVNKLIYFNKNDNQIVNIKYCLFGGKKTTNLRWHKLTINYWKILIPSLLGVVCWRFVL